MSLSGRTPAHAARLVSGERKKVHIVRMALYPPRSAPMLGDARLACVRLELRSPSTNVIPRGPRAHKNVHLYFNAGVAINATKCHTMNLIAICPT